MCNKLIIDMAARTTISMMLSIIIPCYNEDETIGPLLDSIYSQNFPFSFELIIVDDGSDNPLYNVIRPYLNRREVHYYRFKRNHGKGTALRFGISKAKGEFILFQDADLEYFPSDIPKLVNAALKYDLPVVYGSRFLKKPKGMAFSHYIANKILTFFCNILFKTHLTDMETGYKLFKRDVLLGLPLRSTEFDIEAEITLNLLLRKIPIYEVPITYIYRRKGVAKINPMDGIESFIFIIEMKLHHGKVERAFLYRFFKYIVKPHFIRIAVKFMPIAYTNNS